VPLHCIATFRLSAGLFLGLSAVARAQHPQPGDRLTVRIFGGEMPVTDTLTVSEAGSVVLPKLGPVPVATFAIRDVADSLRGRYARYYRNPTVDVTLLRRIVVNGEVRKPDIYYLDVSAKLPDVIAHAGGLTETANAKQVSIHRGNEVTRVPDWQTSGSSVAELRSGDQVVVGRRSWLSLNILPAASTIAVVTSIVLSLRRK
jgi:protein involved in polysaccharide export with SLBB domain